jgi:hypothetical protein
MSKDKEGDDNKSKIELAVDAFRKVQAAHRSSTGALPESPVKGTATGTGPQRSLTGALTESPVNIPVAGTGPQRSLTGALTESPVNIPVAGTGPHRSSTGTLADPLTQATRHKLAKAIAWLNVRQSCTIRQFANCLCGLSPDVVPDMLIIRSDEEIESIRCASVLESCAGISLQPVNPQDPPQRRRYPVGQFQTVAVERRLGYWDVIAPPAVSIGTDRSNRKEQAVREFADRVSAHLESRGVSRDEFCKKGSMAALYCDYCNWLPADVERYSDTVFGDRLNQLGFKFVAGARARAAQEYVQGIFATPEKPTR